MASRSLGVLTVDLIAKVGGFTRGMTQAEREGDKRAKAIERRLQRMGENIQKGMAVAATAVVGAMVAIGAGVKRAVDQADELSKTAQKIGVTTESLSTLGYAAKLADVELSELQAGLGRLTRFQADAAQGAERNIDLFKRLGIEFQNADGTLRDTGEVFREIAGELATLPDGADKSAIAMEAFGRSGANLIPLLNTGSKGIAELEERARRLGLELSTGAGKDAEELNDRLSDLRSVADGLALTLATELLPDIIELTNTLTNAIREGGGMVEVARDLADAIRGIGNIAKGAGNSIEMMSNRLAILGEVKNLLLDPMGGTTYKANIDQLLAENDRLAEANHQLALRARQQLGIDPGPNEPGGVVQWIDPPAPGRGRPRGTPMRDGETVVINAGPGFGEGASTRRSEADRAAAEAARAAEQAARDMEDQIAQANRAQADFLLTTENLRAELEGPLAQVQLDYIRREDELIALAELAGLSQEELASSLDLLEQARLRDVAATEEQIRAQKELEDAIANEGLIRNLDDLRAAFEDNLAAVLTFRKSGKEAITDLADTFIAQMARMVAEQWTEQLLGGMGSKGGGGFGDFLGSIFSAFGGARANGGPIYPGKAYLVGEEGPELVRPMGAGMVTPARETAAMGRTMSQNITFNVQGHVSKRSADQIRADMYRAGQRAVARRY